MAKKKIKKPVSKRVAKPRTTRATLEQRNEALGQPAPKPRKPRTMKPKVVTTTEPAIETVWKAGSAEDFLANTANGPVFIPNYPEQRVEYTKVLRSSFVDDIAPWNSAFTVMCECTSKVITVVTHGFVRGFQKVKEFAFDHPLIFGIGFCVALTGVAVAVATAARYFRW